MRDRLSLIDPLLVVQIPDMALESSELDVMRYLEQVRECSGCYGLSTCKYDGMKMKLRWNPPLLQLVMAGWCDRKNDELQRKEAERVFKEARIPRDLAKMTFSNFNTKGFERTVETSQKSVRGDHPKGIYFFGSPGVGKTHLGVAMLNLWTKRGGQGVYITVPDLLDRLLDFQKDSRKTVLLDQVRKVPFLLLDDMGVEKPTEWAVNQIFSIVDYRDKEKRTFHHSKGLVTVITSNFSLEKLSERLRQDGDPMSGERICSRIADMCMQIEVGGEDRRVLL